MAVQPKDRGAGTKNALYAARAQMAGALKELQGKIVSDVSVHAAQKRIKAARAMLRLLRDALPDVTYRRANAALRDAGRPLSALRDAAVLSGALTQLMENRGAARSGFRRALARERNAIKRDAATSGTGLTSTRRSLLAVYKDSVHWPVGLHGWSILGKGLRRVYALGRRSFAIARADPSVEHLHEWRKQVKYLWHQLAFLKSPTAAQLQGDAQRSHRLANYLGEDHDLAVLRLKALARRGTFPSAVRLEEFLIRIDRRRARLQRKAVALGSRIYEEEPSKFAARVGHSWRKRHPQ